MGSLHASVAPRRFRRWGSDDGTGNTGLCRMSFHGCRGVDSYSLFGGVMTFYSAVSWREIALEALDTNSYSTVQWESEMVRDSRDV